MNKKNKKNKKLKMIGISILIILITILFNLYYEKNHLENFNILNVKYRAKYDGQWTKWVKNGENCGDIKNNSNLEKIEFLFINKNKKESFSYNYYSKKGWNDPISYNEKKRIYNPTAFTFSLNKTGYKNYQICYRTHNNKYGWLEWSCNNEINGTKKQKINSFALKIIPEGSIKKDYLRDFEIENRKKYFDFKGGNYE